MGRLAAGDRIGPYRITASTANVHHATHVDTGHAVMIEVWPDGGTEIGARIAAAAHALQAIHHPGIALVVDYGMLDDGQPWMACDRVPGTVVHDLVAGRSLRADQVAELVRDIAEVLRYAHANNLVHGRLRAHSIVAFEGGVTITGWCVGPSDKNRERSVYDAPEARASEKSDVYALGVIAYRALTGQFPRGCLTTTIPGAPPPLAKLIVEMTAPDPVRRPGAAEIADAIAAMLGVDQVPVDVIAFDDLEDFAPPGFDVEPPLLRRPKWTPATHLAPLPVTSGTTTDEDFDP